MTQKIKTIQIDGKFGWELGRLRILTDKKNYGLVKSCILKEFVLKKSDTIHHTENI